MEEIQEYKDCNICGSKEFKVIYYFHPHYYDHKKFITHSWDGEKEIGLQIVKCKKCKLIYQNPSINEDGLKYIYPESIITGKLDYENLVSNHKFGHLLDVISNYYPNPKNKNLTFLDVGTRFGVLPELLSKKGFNSIGIEMNAQCVKSARDSGFKFIYQGKIDDLKKISENVSIARYNLVVLVDVIEHLLNPFEELENIAKFQKKGDRIIITTMDVDSLGHKIFKKEWYYIHSQHTFYFNIKTIKLLFAKLGYDIEYKFQIPAYKTITILGKELLKYFKHKIERNRIKDYKGEKIWFADNRPHLFDLFTIVLEKR